MREITNWLKLTPVEKNYMRLDPYRMFMSSSKSSHFRLIVFLLTILLPALLFAQMKPKTPVLQAGWKTNCVRALLLNEGSGTSLTDMSGTATVSLNVAAWGSDSEGPYFNNVGSAPHAYIELSTGLPGASISTLSWYMRIKSIITGGQLGWAATFTGAGGRLMNMHWFDPVASDEPQFVLKNGSGTQIAVDTPNDILVINKKYNIVGTYAGDSIRVYLNGRKVGSAPLTGNLANDGYTTRIGQGLDAALDTDDTALNDASVQIYCVAIWQRVLTAAEISQIEKNPYVMFGGVNRPQSVQ